MKSILLATSNARNVVEANAACKDFGIAVEQVELDITEIQHHDPIKIAKHKAGEAFKLVRSPVVITDTYWSIPALNGFPAGYMKDVSVWFEANDFINLMQDKSDRSIFFTETIVYQDSKVTKVFSQKFPGRITETPRGNGESIEQVAEFQGKTIAERRAEGKTSHDPEEYIWYQFARWFSGVGS